MKRAKRIWTPEQRAAAAERMKGMAAKRWAKVREEEASDVPVAVMEPVEPSVSSVAVLEKPVEVTQIPWNVEPAHDAVLKPEPVRDVTRVGSREVVLRVRTDGQMVSLQGPCVCGAMKREWHQICLKEASHVA